MVCGSLGWFFYFVRYWLDLWYGWEVQNGLFGRSSNWLLASVWEVGWDFWFTSMCSSVWDFLGFLTLRGLGSKKNCKQESKNWRFLKVQPGKIHHHFCHNLLVKADLRSNPDSPLGGGEWQNHTAKGYAEQEVMVTLQPVSETHASLEMYLWLGVCRFSSFPYVLDSQSDHCKCTKLEYAKCTRCCD